MIINNNTLLRKYLVDTCNDEAISALINMLRSFYRATEALSSHGMQKLDDILWKALQCKI